MLRTNILPRTSCPDAVFRHARMQFYVMLKTNMLPKTSTPDVVSRHATMQFYVIPRTIMLARTSSRDVVLRRAQDVKPRCSFTSCPGRQAQMQFCKSNLVVFHNSCNQYLYSIFISSDEVVALLFTLNMHMW